MTATTTQPQFPARRRGQRLPRLTHSASWDHSRVWGKQGPGDFFGRSPRPARCSAAAQGELFLIRKSFAHVASSVWNAHPLSASLAAHDQQEKERLLPALKSALSPKGTGGPSSKRPIMVPFSCEAGTVTLPHFTNLSCFSTLCQSRD